AAEQIDVVDVEAPERCLQSLEHVAQLHAQHLHLVAIDVEVDGGVAGGESREHPAQTGVGIGSDDEAAQYLSQRRRLAAAQVLQNVGEASARSQAEDRGWREG